MNALVNFPDRPVAHFSFADLAKANTGWGCNCGPAALAAVTGVQLFLAGASLPGFMEKGFTNPTMMGQALKDLGIRFQIIRSGRLAYFLPIYAPVGVISILRIQFDGPWCRPEVPPAAAYKHTHWVGLMFHGGVYHVFDINSMDEQSRWETAADWEAKTVKELAAEVKRCAGWFVTHRYELEAGQ